MGGGRARAVEINEAHLGDGTEHLKSDKPASDPWQQWFHNLLPAIMRVQQARSRPRKEQHPQPQGCIKLPATDCLAWPNRCRTREAFGVRGMPALWRTRTAGACEHRVAKRWNAPHSKRWRAVRCPQSPAELGAALPQPPGWVQGCAKDGVGQGKPLKGLGAWLAGASPR